MLNILLILLICLFFQREGVIQVTWLGNKLYIFTDDEKLFKIRDNEPETLLMLLIPGCLGNACEPQKLLNI